MNDKRVLWAEGRLALVRWRSLWGGEWVECVGMMAGETSDVLHDPPFTIPARKTWKALTRGGRVDDGLDRLETRPLPDHCGTCFDPFGCGCPGDGWSVPVHVRLPEVSADVGLHLAAGAGLHGWESSGQWQIGGYGREPGATCRPVVPFRNGAPIYLKPWKEP